MGPAETLAHAARTGGPSRGGPSRRRGAGGLPHGGCARHHRPGTDERKSGADSCRRVRRAPAHAGRPACLLVLAQGLNETFRAVIANPDAAEHFLPDTDTMIMPDRIARTRSLRSDGALARPALALRAAAAPPEPRPLHRTAARGVISNEAAFFRSSPAATVAPKCQIVHSRQRSRPPWRPRSCRSPHVAGAAVPAAASRPVPP